MTIQTVRKKCTKAITTIHEVASSDCWLIEDDQYFSGERFVILGRTRIDESDIDSLYKIRITGPSFSIRMIIGMI